MRDVFFFNLFVTQGPGFSPKRRKKNTGEKKLQQDFWLSIKLCLSLHKIKFNAFTSHISSAHALEL